ncbi:hypothetical protein [Caballeronia sp. GaOx3]|uniref:NHL domain-containing protein n=1 Tax=Caballeronia sp. GaOx3 TaxID=2921740 RepID=UPI002027F52D|nr:hypothetical protein [Caballeronia sp. GaOx3]
MTIIAGTGQAGYSGDGGPATQALLDYPTGVALDRAGNVFVGDSGNARVVRRVDRDTGVITTVAGPHPIRLDAGRKHHTLASEAPFQERVTLFQWLHTKSLPTRHASTRLSCRTNCTALASVRAFKARWAPMDSIVDQRIRDILRRRYMLTPLRTSLTGGHLEIAPRR